MMYGYQRWYFISDYELLGTPTWLRVLEIVLLVLQKVHLLFKNTENRQNLL